MSSTIDRVDQIADQLREDPVLLAPVSGNGALHEHLQTLHDDIAALPYPAYVAIIERVPGDGVPERAEELAALVHHRIEQDGLYVVGVDGNVSIIAPGVEDVFPAAVSLARYEITQPGGADAPTPDDPDLVAAAEAHLLLALAPVVGDDYESAAAREAIDELGAEVLADPVMTTVQVPDDVLRAPDRPDSDAADWGFLAIALGVGVAVALATRRYLAWRVARSMEPADGAGTERELVEHLLEQIDLLTPPHDPVHHATFVAALREREAAGRLVDSPDVADRVGARVLAERAHQRAQSAGRGEPPPPHQPPCYLDPRHGAATTTTAPPGVSASLSVPCCSQCAGAVAAGHDPDVLTVRRRGRSLPYFHRDDVWTLTGFGALRDDVADLVLAGGRAGRKPSGTAHR